jgi:hypothetical protein
VIASERTEKKMAVSSEDQSNAIRVVSFGDSLGMNRKENTTFAQQQVLRTNSKEKTTLQSGHPIFPKM